jgi:hypothetical protein
METCVMRAAIGIVLLTVGLATWVEAARADPRDLAQRSLPDTPVPGGLPGVMAPPSIPQPMQAPPVMVPAPAAPALQVPPPPVPAVRGPDSGGPEVCDCRVEIDVPIYENGQIVRWRREQRVTGRASQCCRK